VNVVDLFCGAGGFSEGFRQAGFQVVAGADSDPDACATFAHNFSDAVCIHGDLRTATVQRRLLAASSSDTIVVGGPPCQAFSQVRNHARLIDDARNSLYREFVKFVRDVTPNAFVMENVLGLQQMGVKEQVLQDLSLDGRYLVTAQVLDAADFGVPQTRKRLVFIGFRRELGAPFPALRGSDATSLLGLERRKGKRAPKYAIVSDSDPRSARILEQLLDPDDESVVTAEQAIGDLKMLATGERSDVLSRDEMLPAQSAYQRRMRRAGGKVVTNTSVPRINEDTVLRLAGLPPGGNYRDLPEELRDRYLTGMLWGPNNGTGLLGRRHYYAYRRLHPSFWSWTLNTKADSVYHYDERRALSVREFARLQSFPDRFVFSTDPAKGPIPGRIDGGAAHSRYRQVGNAVPPLLARAVASAVASAVNASTAPSRRTA